MTRWPQRRHARAHAIAEHLAALPTVEPLLRGLDRVWHVDVGYRYRAGRVTNEVTLRIFVNGAKASRRSRRRGLAPARIHGLLIDVIAGTFRPHTGIGGDEIHLVDAGAGTLGVVLARIGDPGSRIGITAWHVAKTLGDTVYLGTGTGTVLGTVTSIDPDTRVSLLDVDADTTTGAIPGTRPITRIMPSTEMDNALATKLKVFKYGATTGRTVGRITGWNNITNEITVSSIDGSPIVEGGDSGAVWVSQVDGAAVGLHQGGSELHSNSVPVGEIAMNEHLFLP